MVYDEDDHFFNDNPQLSKEELKAKMKEQRQLEKLLKKSSSKKQSKIGTSKTAVTPVTQNALQKTQKSSSG